MHYGTNGKRKLIQKNENKVSILQIVGFILLLFGVVSLIICSFRDSKLIASVVSISFFITMLGFSFAFPTLLQGNDGLSTMRIVVFMMTNVICMLLLKIGWSEGIQSLKSIGLDQYWVGVIAFVFGAKAAQSFSETRATKPIVSDSVAVPDKKDIPVEVPENIIKEAIDKNSKTWMDQYSVMGVALGKKKISGIMNGVNCIVFKPKTKIDTDKIDQTKMIPDYIQFRASDGNLYSIPTDVQQTGGTIRSSYLQPAVLNTCSGLNPKRPGCSVSRVNSNIAGTIGVKVYKNNQDYILSCYHVLCEPELNLGIDSFDINNANETGIISPGKLDGGLSTNVIGSISEGKINNYLDCAIGVLNNSGNVSENICLIDTAPNQVLIIDNSHVQEKYEIKIVGRTSGFQLGNITSSYCSATIEYFIKGKWETKFITGLIGTTRISDDGDSGAAVIDDFGNLIGIVVASAPYETYIIPIVPILSEFNISLTKT